LQRLAESDDHPYPRVVEAGLHGRVDDSEPVSGLYPRRRDAFAGTPKLLSNWAVF
jgi:hypothetical protein